MRTVNKNVEQTYKFVLMNRLRNSRCMSSSSFLLQSIIWPIMIQHTWCRNYTSLAAGMTQIGLHFVNDGWRNGRTLTTY